MEPPTDISGIEMVEIRTPSVWIPITVMGGTVAVVAVVAVVLIVLALV